MNLKVERFINQLMTSNCYIVVDEESKHCLCIDPASEKSEREIEYIEQNNLTLDYIILTHEHTDHTWGVNALKEKCPKTCIVCSELCEKYAKKASRAYFLFYFSAQNYKYEMLPADIVIHKDEDELQWGSKILKFIFTPGHSRGAMCIVVDYMLFTGDTIMPFPPYFNGRDSNEEDWKKSINRIKIMFQKNILIYPGHGDSLTLSEWEKGGFSNVK